VWIRKLVANLHNQHEDMPPNSSVPEVQQKLTLHPLPPPLLQQEETSMSSLITSNPGVGDASNCPRFYVNGAMARLPSA